MSLEPNAQDVADRSADFRRYDAPNDLVDAAVRAVDQTADGLGERCPNLARVLRQRPADGPPLMAGAFAYFFRQTVEKDAALFRGLTFDKLRQLEVQLHAVLEEVSRGLEDLGKRFDERLDDVVKRLEDLILAAHRATLDVHAALNQLASQHLDHTDEIRLLLQQVQKQLEHAGQRPGEVRPRDTLSIRSEDEKRAVRQLLARFRQLPAEEQQQVPALLNGLGRLQVGAGDFGGARQTFSEVACTVGDSRARAEARYNAFRAALEERKWEEALTAVREAAALDTARFAPFPLQRYEPRRILGAGGFGTAYQCYDRYLRVEVVVKVFHIADLDRTPEELFAEAHILRGLRHPNIIEVLDCNYADPSTSARPYLVMDYFPGGSLEAFVREQGPLVPADLVALARQIAGAIQASHAQGVLHRDLKPENVLVRKEGERWQVKVIDFGLALRREPIETSVARAKEDPTLLGNSVAGTMRYAPPEQMGVVHDTQGRRVRVGPYSDVYAFGKLCCHALFRSTEPKRRQWATIPEGLADLLERCIEQELEQRHPDFEPIIHSLATLDLVEAEGSQKEQAEVEARRQAEEAERQRRKQQEIEAERRAADEAERKRVIAEQRDHEATQRRQQGESLLVTTYREMLERTQDNLTSEDMNRLGTIASDHGIALDQANAVLRPIKADYARRVEANKAKQLEADRKADGEKRQQQEATLLRQQGEGKLAEAHRQAFDHSNGKHRGDVGDLCRQYDIPDERANAILREVWDKWQLDHRTPKDPTTGDATQHRALNCTTCDGVSAADVRHAQEAWAKYLKREIEETVDIGNGVNITFVLVPPGKFLMGSPEDEDDRNDDETLHEVTLTEPFYLSKYPVTQEQYEALVGFNPSEFKGATFPVESVNWEEAQDYAARLTKKLNDKQLYRLPTESEWEYACRGGRAASKPFGIGDGHSLSSLAANFDGNYPYGGADEGPDLESTCDIGSYPANALGLFDMHGNVWEWCADWDGPYPTREVTNPSGSSGGSDRVSRGGSWFDFAWDCRAANRKCTEPSFREDILGFRLARSLPSVSK